MTKNRISEIDALRGFALFGILLVNVFVFHAPLCYYGEFYGTFTGIQATTINWVVDFAGGKFLLIFAFLFGYGIVLQEQSRPGNFQPYFIRRMLVLFIFGALHILLFWFGDILATYALLGLIILPLIKQSKRNLLILSAFFLLFRPLYYTGALYLDWTMNLIVKPVPLEEFLLVFQQGSYGAIFLLRMKEFWAFMPENLVWYVPKTLGCFFMGLYAARIDLFARLRRNRFSFFMASMALLFVSTFWMVFKSDFFGWFDLKSEPYWRPPLIAINIFFETSLGIGYILFFGLVFQYDNGLSKALAKTGRMALTIYLMQSLICVLIFYGFGLGYYGKLRPTDLVLLTLVLFAVNMFFSVVYLKFYQSGPLEHLWRKLIQKNPN